ncbi:MAG TPA: hypothetical protein VFI36_00530, partial [Arthrobacter sp.]|nr:hypothetical protein [Arthrobacter sp.]
MDPSLQFGCAAVEPPVVKYGNPPKTVHSALPCSLQLSHKFAAYCGYYLIEGASDAASMEMFARGAGGPQQVFPHFP